MCTRSCENYGGGHCMRRECVRRGARGRGDCLTSGGRPLVEPHVSICGTAAQNSSREMRLSPSEAAPRPALSPDDCASVMTCMWMDG